MAVEKKTRRTRKPKAEAPVEVVQAAPKSLEDRLELLERRQKSLITVVKRLASNKSWYVNSTIKDRLDE